MIKRILVANRGEIAVRVMRSCREMEITSIAIFSEADRTAKHVLYADEAYCVGPAASKESYLNIEKIIEVAKANHADAIHPGYGFLSENAAFARRCQEEGIIFIGPNPETMEAMGDKISARIKMIEAGVPVVPGTQENLKSVEEAVELCNKIGYPVMLKASMGGGGKGMRIASSHEEFENHFHLAQQESINAFGDHTMYIEKYIEKPRHIEIQILADKYGNTLWLGERDCSIQRRHQKVMEESPCAVIDADLRQRMGETAVQAAKAVGYENAGTIEFLLDKDKNFYFMEMNTRIQVEHPVTEMVTGIDLVKEQIRIAAGEKLKIRQEEIKLKGHAIECRINAEDPQKNFMPCPGTVEDLHFPGGNGVRIESALYNGYVIPPYYDSMVAKVIVHGEDRMDAIRKMRSALGEVVVDGITTNLDFQYDILNHPAFLSGDINTHFIPDYFEKE